VHGIKHTLTMTQPGEQVSYQAICSCGWVGTEMPIIHNCAGDHSDADAQAYWVAVSEAERAAVEDGSEHMADLS
jgi:hypothetical protein